MIKEKEFAFQEAIVVEDVGGDAPIQLHENHGIWYIEEGHVDLFAVRFSNGVPTSRRRHIGRFEAGESLFGVPKVEDGYGLLAVGQVQTALRYWDTDWCLANTWSAQQIGFIAGLFDVWIEKIAGGMFPFVPPKEHKELLVEEEVMVESGAVLRAKEQVCWLVCEEGTIRLFGVSAYPLLGPVSPFPVNGKLWVETEEVTKATTRSTLQMIEEGVFEEVFNRTHRCLFDAYDTRLLEEEKDERDRLQRKAEVDRSALKKGSAYLADVIERKRQRIFLKANDPLLAACQLVGEQIGVEMKAPPTTEESLKRRRDQLKEIARFSRVRLRKVALRGEWWRKDGGPMLGLIQDEESKTNLPVALLPIKGRRYEMHNPTSGEVEIIAGEGAENLHPFSYSFYRPFPDRKLTSWDVFKFGAKGCRSDFLLILLLGIAGGILNMFTPIVTGAIFNTIIPEAERTQLSQIMVALIAVAIAIAIFQLARGIAVLRVESRMDAAVQSAVWDRLLNLPTGFFRKFSAGDLAVRAGSISSMRHLLSGVTVSSIMSGLFSIFNLLLLFYYDHILAFWALGLTMIALIVSVVGSFFQFKHQRVITELQSRLSGKVLQFITGITKLRVAGAESKAFEIWARNFGEQRKLQFRARSIGNVTATFNAMYPVLSTGIIFGIMILVQDAEDIMITGDFIAFNSALGTFTASMLSMTAAFVAIQMAIPLYEQARPILEALPEVDTSKMTPDTLKGEVDVKHVSFRYDLDGPIVLDDVSITARQGEFVALVGPSGSGKSTILRLLLGFDLPEAGTIFYDGQELDGLDVQAIRRQIGVVLQNGRLMSGDLFTNIVGSTNATLDDAWAAAKMAGFDEDINQMPMGMHTVVSEGGNTLSGGQRQRLMIARAIVNKPRLLFFDEATSALDNRTQQIVSESLDRLQATRIVVAHRLTTIQNADRIYVVDKGRVVQQGTFDELMQKNGLFAELAKRQLV